MTPGELDRLRKLRDVVVDYTDGNQYLPDFVRYTIKELAREACPRIHGRIILSPTDEDGVIEAEGWMFGQYAKSRAEWAVKQEGLTPLQVVCDIIENLQDHMIKLYTLSSVGVPSEELVGVGSVHNVYRKEGKR